MSAKGSRSRSRSRSQSRTEITSLEILSADQLLDTVTHHTENLLRYALGTDRLPHMHIAEHARDMIARASELIVERCTSFKERYNLLREEKTREIAEYRTEIYKLNETRRGAETEINDLKDIINQKNAEFNALKDNLTNIIVNKDKELEASEELIANYQRVHNLLNQRLAEWDVQIRNYH